MAVKESRGVVPARRVLVLNDVSRVLLRFRAFFLNKQTDAVPPFMLGVGVGRAFQIKNPIRNPSQCVNQSKASKSNSFGVNALESNRIAWRFLINVRTRLA